MARAITSGIKLTANDAAVVKGMLRRGDRQHDIASWFGVNGGRIAEISSRTKFSDVVIQMDRLPPVGPYISGRQSHATRQEINTIIQKLADIERRGQETFCFSQISKVKAQLEIILDNLK